MGLSQEILLLISNMWHGKIWITSLGIPCFAFLFGIDVYLYLSMDTSWYGKTLFVMLDIMFFVVTIILTMPAA